MGLPVTFGPLTAASMGQLDQNFAAVGALTTVQCTSTGTNAIVLTPAANQPAVTGYGLPHPLKFGFVAPASSSGSVTLEVGALGFLPVYTPNGVQATSGTLVSGNYYEVTYTTGSVYNSGSGAWVLSSYQTAAGSTPLSASTVRALSIANNAGTPNTQIDVSCLRSCLVNVSGSPAFITSAAFTIDLTTGTVTSTANGMAGMSRPASGWVYLYAISTGSGMAGLATTASPLASTPTLPAGYSYYAYLGAMYCDGSSNLMRTRQRGADTQYTLVAASNTIVNPIIYTAAGNITTWTAEPLGAFVPPTASKLRGLLYANTGVTCNVGVSSNGFGTLIIGNSVLFQNTNNSSMQMACEILLESTNIYAGSSGAVTSQTFSALGWTDYVSAAA